MPECMCTQGAGIILLRHHQHINTPIWSLQILTHTHFILTKNTHNTQIKTKFHECTLYTRWADENEKMDKVFLYIIIYIFISFVYCSKVSVMGRSEHALHLVLYCLMLTANVVVIVVAIDVVLREEPSFVVIAIHSICTI